MSFVRHFVGQIVLRQVDLQNTAKQSDDTQPLVNPKSPTTNFTSRAHLRQGVADGHRVSNGLDAYIGVGALTVFNAAERIIR